MQNSEFYPKESFLNDKKTNSRFLIVSIAILLFGIALFLLSGLLIKESNLTLFIVIDSLILFLTFTAFFYLILFIYYPRKYRLRFVYRLLTADRFSGNFLVKEIKSNVQVGKGIYVDIISGINEDGQKVNYSIEKNINFSFKIDKQYQVIVARDYIVGVLDNEG